MVTKSDRRELVEKLEITRQRLMDQALNLPEPKMTESAKDGDRTPKGMLLHRECYYILSARKFCIGILGLSEPEKKTSLI